MGVLFRKSKVEVLFNGVSDVFKFGKICNCLLRIGDVEEARDSIFRGTAKKKQFSLI